MCFRSRSLQQNFLSKTRLFTQNLNFSYILRQQQKCFTHRAFTIRTLPGPLRTGTTFASPSFVNISRTVCCQLRQYTKDQGQPRITEELLKNKDISRNVGLPDSEQSSEDRSKKEEKKKDSWFSGKNAWKLGLISLGACSFLMCGNLIMMWGRPMLDEEMNEVRDEYSDLPKWQAYPLRTWREARMFKKMIQEPSSDKLLPDPVTEPYYQPPYTLVLELTGVLVHPDWTLSTGWRFKKRPGVEFFLQQIGPPMYEVVVYTHEQGLTASPIVDGLDSQGYIFFRLFRDATRYMDGTHVKDLDCLNRDTKRVILVDCDPKAFKLHARNGIYLKKWLGNDDDRTLIDLASFLRTIAASNVDDVRTVLDYYNQFDDPLGAFKENQRKLQEEQLKSAQAQKEDKEKPSLIGNWSLGLSGRKR